MSYRVVYLPDIHTPMEDKFSLAAVKTYLFKTQPDEIIIGGDFLDLNCISSHNAKNLRAVEGQTIEKDIKYANTVLDSLQAVCPVKFTYIEGNHEFRLNRYVDANPRMAGILEVPKLLRLAERRIKWVPQWSKGTVHKIGKATFLHGELTCDNHAKAMVSSYGDNVFYAHCHDVQSYSKKTKGDNKTRVGQSLGCLCSYAQAYMRGTTSRWQQGFGVFHFMPDGHFNYYVVRIFNHRFISPEGVLYDGKELMRKAA